MDSVIIKREAFKRLVDNPDFKLLVHEMNKLAKSATRKQLDCDPFTEQHKIAECRILRNLLTVVIPERIQGIINYQPAAPDKQAAPKDKWQFLTYWQQIKSYFK